MAAQGLKTMDESIEGEFKLAAKGYTRTDCRRVLCKVR